MLKEYIESFRQDLKEFHEITAKFYRKEISVAEYKSFSGGFGSYAQRGGEKSMLRLRLCGGEINKENLKFIADSMDKYQIDLAHFTTCQTIQLHNLSELTVCKLIEEAFDHGIITRGGGGDYPRNVMCSPLSGVTMEPFDVLPYAKLTADYLLCFINKVKLPRKLKVCFSNGEQNETHATFRDLGFVATSNHTFDVYAAGGVGLKPKMGVQVASDIPPEKVLYCIKTMVDVFAQYGNYKNRAAARTRFLQDTLGVDGFIEIYKKQLEENLKSEDLDIQPQPDPIHKKGEGTLSAPRLIPQKQEGLYAIFYHPAGGLLRQNFFREMYEATKEMDEVKLRISPTQGVYIINLTAQEASKILALTEDGAETLFETSTACIGAAICQVGIGNSPALLESCIKRIKEEHFPDKVLPAIRISGCPSSCAVHPVGILGFRGGKKSTPDGPQFAFAVYDGGCEALGYETFGKELGVMLQDDIPDFLVTLGQKINTLGLTYETFRTQHPECFNEIVAKYI